MRAWQIRYMRLERRCDRGETQRGGGDSIVLGLTEVVSKTGFHPVWDISYQKPCFLVQILRLHRFDLVPTYKIRPAGVNFQIWQFMLSVSVTNCFTRKWSTVDFFLACKRESPMWQLNLVVQKSRRFLFNSLTAMVSYMRPLFLSFVLA